MARVNHSEHQSFRQLTWVWAIVIPVAFLSSVSIFYGFYQQIVLGKPWGNQPMSDTGLIIAVIGISALEILIIWMVASLTLTIEVTSEEFRYKFFAYFTRWSVLTTNQIASYSLEKWSFWKGRGLGYHQDIFSKTVRIIIKPSYILRIATQDGRTIIMSIENREAMERAMQKLMSKNENY